MLEMSRGLCEHGDALPRPEGSRHAETNHIRALLDCIDFCATCVSFLLRDSPARVRDLRRGVRCMRRGLRAISRRRRRE